MRILLVTHFFPPRHNAGTENYTLGLARSLQSRGNDVQVICAEDWNSGESYWNGVVDEMYQGVHVKRIRLNWMKAEDPNQVLYHSGEVKQWMTQWLEKESFDVVHVLSSYSLGIGLMESVSAARIPLILTLMDFWYLCPTLQLIRSNGELCDGHTTALQCQTCLLADLGSVQKISRLGISPEVQVLFLNPLSYLKIFAKQQGFRGRLLNISERKRLLQDSIKLPDLVLSHSNIVREIFSLHTDREIRILQNGHELSWLGAYKGKSVGDRLRIGYVGQVISIKGVHVLVEAFQEGNFGDKATLDIWGGHEEGSAYINQLKTLIGDDPRISLRGRFAHEKLAEVFSTIDVLVVPSLWYENAPLVIQEAFAAKIPVLTTNLGGMREAVLDEVNGLLFERDSAGDLARQLRRLITEPALLERLAAGIPEVKTIEEESGELEGIYSDLVQKRKNHIHGDVNNV
jgi:glycosyltransferase involved in cell wall biosynthesis